MILLISGFPGAGVARCEEIAAALAAQTGGAWLGRDWPAVRPDMADAGPPVHALRVAEPLPALESTLTGGGAAWVFAYRDMASSLATAVRHSGESSPEGVRAMARGMLGALEHAASRPRTLLLRWEEHAERPAWTLAEIESLCAVRLGRGERQELLEALQREVLQRDALQRDALRGATGERVVAGATLDPALRAAAAQELRAFEARFGAGATTRAA